MSISQLQYNKQINKLFKSILNQNENQLLGGGGCCSSQSSFNSFQNTEGTQINNIIQHNETEILYTNLQEKNVNFIQKTDENQTNNNLQIIEEHKKQTQQKADLNHNQKIVDTQIDNNGQKKEFEIYNEIWRHKEKIIQCINHGNQQNLKKDLLKQCIEIKDYILKDEQQIYTQKEQIQDILETYLLIEITTISHKSNQKKDEFDRLLNEIKQIEVYDSDFPIMELVFQVDILINLNKIDIIFDENQQQELKELVILILNFRKNEGDFSEILTKVSNVKKFIYKYENKKQYVGMKYYIGTWLKKIDEFGDNFILKSQDISSEILFYVKIFFEIYKQSNSQEQIILTLIRINYLIQKFQNDKANRNKQIYEQFSNHLIKNNIDEFLNQIMQKSDLFINKIFLIFTIENQYYRYITLSILFNIISVFKHTTQNTQNQKYLSDFLTNKYLIEKELAIRVLFEKSIDTEFVQNFDQNIQNKEFKQNIIKFDEQRKEMILPHFEQLQDFERSVHSFDDIIKLIAENAIQKWERDIKKRQRQNIAQKDDVLLEVKDLYINQMITYLKGNQIFQKQKQIEGHSLSEQNALQDILQLFLNPNLSYKQKLQEKNESTENEDEEIFQDLSKKCQILAILAEGGTGKSMLIKKLETFLIEKLGKINTETETGNYLPLLIKFNCLDSKKPSLDDYLKQYGGINMDQIKNLKQNERKKLILFDGYDEYTGDYFDIYKTLKLNEWKNTKVVVATRKEKLSEEDACKYFSILNESGEKDEKSFCLVKLEEFTKKDIDEYAQRYFKQERKTDAIEKDLKYLNDCMAKNKEFEKLLHLPINLYLFTRIIVNINENEIENLKTNVSDQIGIQEIFFSNQFEREVQLFIDNHIHSNDMKKDQELRKSLKNYYFEYFQTIAMIMFQNRGQKSNYLQVEKSSINFEIQKFVINNIQESKQIANNLLEKINNYINSKIVTRSKEKIEINEENKVQSMKYLIEFKHKSLFEYFGARAMKYDFDVNGDNIYKLDIEKLKLFNINKKSIMNIGQNQSEQQILIKFYKMIKNEIESEEFYSTYYLDLIEKNSKYIQYIKKSTIKRSIETSEIDIGASNMLSVLFVSYYAYNYLELNFCSLSKLYVSCEKSNKIKLNYCNLQNSYLLNMKINYDTCNIQFASLDSHQKVFDSQTFSSFKQVIWDKRNELYTINKQGFINSFKVDNQNIYLQKSKQFSDLSHILVNDSETILVSSNCSLFSINSSSFELLQSYEFENEIESIIMIKENILIKPYYSDFFYGSFKNGFKKLYLVGSRCVYNESKQILIVFSEGNFTLYNAEEDFKQIKTIKGHNTIIKSFSFSEDGKYLATCSYYGTCKIWHADKAFKLIKTIKGTNSIVSVTFSADGKYLAIGSEDKTCKIWNAKKDFKLINSIQGHTESINSVAFSKDGKYFSTASEDNTCIWNAEKDFELINSFQAHTDQIKSVAFSANGKYLATGSMDRTCKIWNAEKCFELINTIQGHTGSVYSVGFSADGKYLATSSSDNTCKIWNAKKDFELINTIQGHYETVAFSSDGKYLATGSWDKFCKIWNADSSFELVNTVYGHTDFVISVAFSANGKFLATGSRDRTCKIWNAEKDFELLNTIQGHNTYINSVAFSVDSKYLATGSNGCKIWNAQKGFELINTIQGTISSVQSVAFSSDGKFFLTDSKIWNVEKGFELINTIQDYFGFEKHVAFSADGKQIAISSDKIYKIWNVEKGFEIISIFQGHTWYVKSVAFSVDGKFLATGSLDKTCNIWNTEKGFEHIKTIYGHTSDVKSVAFSANGKYLATGSMDETCKIWNADQEFELINTIQGHIDSVNSVAFSVDGKYLATGSRDKTCKIWSVEKSFELINTIQDHTESINSVAFSADRKYLATGSGDNTCKIWNADSGFELIKTIQAHTKGINSLAFSSNRKYLVTGSRDCSCKIWSVEKSFELINTIEGDIGQISTVAFSTDGKYLAAGTYKKCCVWSAEKNFELINTIKGFTEDIYSVAFSADGRYLATSAKDKTCKILNADKSYELINKIQGHFSYINTVAFSANGKYFTTSSRDKTFKIWNAESNYFKIINIIQGHTDCVNSVAFSVDGKYLATGSDDNTCKIWNAEKNFDLINTIQGHTKSINSVTFSADGRYLATSSEDKTCKIWNAEKGFQIINTIQDHTASINSVAFSSDGKYLATGSRDKICNVWNAQKDFELIYAIKGHSSEINSVTFSADGKYLATGSLDTTCKIWNAEKDFELINTIQGHIDSVNSVAFSVDGKYLATGSRDKTCKIWSVEKSFELINTIQDQTDSINSVAFCPYGKYICLKLNTKFKLYDIFNLQIVESNGKQKRPKQLRKQQSIELNKDIQTVKARIFELMYNL